MKRVSGIKILERRTCSYCEQQVLQCAVPRPSIHDCGASVCFDCCYPWGCGRLRTSDPPAESKEWLRLYHKDQQVCKAHESTLLLVMAGWCTPEWTDRMIFPVLLPLQATGLSAEGTSTSEGSLFTFFLSTGGTGGLVSIRERNRNTTTQRRAALNGEHRTKERNSTATDFLHTRDFGSFKYS